MAESKPVPFESLNSILTYLDTQRRLYEDADEQFNHVLKYAAKVRDWLSSIDMSKRDPDDTETDPGVL